MPYKDPEQRKEANRIRMQRRRAEGAAWIDPEKEKARKLRWYEGGGKEKMIADQRVRRGEARAEKISKIK